MQAFVAATPALEFQTMTASPPTTRVCWANALGSGVKTAAPKAKTANIGAWIRTTRFSMVSSYWHGKCV